MCMKKSICDLVTGNMPGASDPHEVSNPGMIKKAQAAVTRTQAKKVEQTLKPLVTSNSPDAKRLTVDERQKAQRRDQGVPEL